MMAWQKYTLVFKLLSPLHVGYRKVGNLLQTRKYVTGKLIWAALTARLTRDFADGGSANEYQRIGDLLKKQFRFGYFYPALMKETRSDIKASDDVEECPFWENEAEFDYTFLNSYASTALDYAFQSAEDGSLHEVELIAPKTRPWGNEEARQVYLKGDIYYDAGRRLIGPIINWQKVLSKLQLGAERNAGWGRVELILLSEPQSAVPEIEYDAAERVKAHVLCALGAPDDYDSALKIDGEIEPLLGWERAPYNAQGRTWQLSFPFICYAPGSRVKEEMKLRICVYYGILEPI